MFISWRSVIAALSASGSPKFKIWNRSVITLFLYEMMKHRTIIVCVLIRPQVIDFQFSAEFLHLKALVGNGRPINTDSTVQTEV